MTKATKDAKPRTCGLQAHKQAPCEQQGMRQGVVVGALLRETWTFHLPQRDR
jgi:hypothetical protein